MFERISNDVEIPSRYQALVERHLQRLYLDEMGSIEELSLELGIVRLIVESPKRAGEAARNLLERAKTEVDNLSAQRQVIELIETIIVYKFPQMSRQEIETMLRIEGIQETRVYQEGKLEGRQEGKLEQKLEMIPLLAQKGFSIEEIAELVDLEPEIVRKALSS